MTANDQKSSIINGGSRRDFGRSTVIRRAYRDRISSLDEPNKPGGDEVVLTWHVYVYVGAVPEDGLAPPNLAVDEHRDEVSHGAGGDEESGLLSRHPRHLLL
ncbi:unnamed protein product [Spirodela intermedia]|uniref:Uncharacterized protein n=1 Tax=Spirodela intermedia TaxID=51605 RepID=A0A7I8ID23_SPIIN|nr:unnamed protein product [Spirodela intermedia]CAA6655284.1 unnamed protein product [Spirodela intermedia]